MTAYGMGLSIGELHGHKRVWHNGETNGSMTMDALHVRRPLRERSMTLVFVIDKRTGILDTMGIRPH